MNQNIWLPGAGLVPIHVREAQQAIEDYDADFGLGRDEVTGDWVVLQKRGPDGYPFPVFNLGQELPNRDTIMRRLYHADVRRRGHKIVADIVRRNDERQKQLRDESHEAAGEVAEVIDTYYHLRKNHPRPRIFVPGR